MKAEFNIRRLFNTNLIFFSIHMHFAGLSIAIFGSGISCRKLTILGGSIVSISLSCAIFAKSIWHLFLVMFFSGKLKIYPKLHNTVYV